MNEYIYLWVILGIIVIGLFNIRFLSRAARSIGLFFASIGRIFQRRKHPSTNRTETSGQKIHGQNNTT